MNWDFLKVNWVDKLHIIEAETKAKIEIIEAETKSHQDKNASDFLWNKSDKLEWSDENNKRQRHKTTR